MTEEPTLAEERFFELMKRVRQLGLDSYPLQSSAVSPAQLALLDWIGTSDGCGVQDIAEGLKLTPPTVSVGVRRLEEAGLLKRKPHLQDKRAVQFFLTVKGQSLRRQSQNFRRQKFKLILSGLTQQEQDTMIGLLEKALQIAETKKIVMPNSNCSSRQKRREIKIKEKEKRT